MQNVFRLLSLKWITNISSCLCHTIVVELQFKFLISDAMFDSRFYLGQKKFSLVNVNLAVQDSLSSVVFISSKI